jgi:hypothetical protein
LGILFLDYAKQKIFKLQEDVRRVVEQQDERADPDEVDAEAHREQEDGDQVVDDHLPEVGAAHVEGELAAENF